MRWYLLRIVVFLVPVFHSGYATDYYAILGVDPKAKEGVVREAYRKKAKQLHPDRNPGDPAAATAFKKVQEAYETLSDPIRRAAYDRGEASQTSDSTPFAESLFKVKLNKRGAPAIDSNRHLLTQYLYVEPFLSQITHWRNRDPLRWQRLELWTVNFLVQAELNGVERGFENIAAWMLRSVDSSAAEREAVRLVLKAFLPAYFQSVPDWNSPSADRTLAAVRHLGVEVEALHWSSQDLLENLSREFDPLAFQKKVMRHLANSNSFSQEWLSKAGAIYTDHFGGDEGHFIGFVLLFHWADFGKDYRLSHRTPRERELITFLIDSLQRSLFGVGQLVPRAEGAIDSELKARSIRYAWFLYRFCEEVPVNPKLRGFYAEGSIPYLRLREWLAAEPNIIETLEKETAIPTAHWKWFLGPAPEPFTPWFRPKVQPTASRDPKKVSFRGLDDFAAQLRRAQDKRAFLQGSFEKLLLLRSGTPSRKTASRRFSVLLELAQEATRYSDVMVNKLLREALERKGFGNIHWTLWLLDWASELARSDAQFLALVGALYEGGNMRSFGVGRGMHYDIEVTQSVRRSMLGKILSQWAAQQDEGNLRRTFSLLLRQLESLSKPGVDPQLVYDALLGDVFSQIWEQRSDPAVAQLWNVWRERLPQVDELGPTERPHISCASELHKASRIPDSG